MHAPVIFLWSALLTAAAAGDFYATGFENFTAGADRIAGAPASGTSPLIPATDSWTGSHAGQDRSGIMAESSHALPGLGNAAYLGGNTSAIFSGGSIIFVRRSLNRQPAVEGNEVVTIRALVGIKDSSGLTPQLTTRDDFEILIYGNNALSGGSGSAVLGGIQFDNSQLSTTTGLPYKAIYRYFWNPAKNAMDYSYTSVDFVYDTMQSFEIRINYRTNKWSAYFQTVPLFSDLDFYKGPAALNLGSILLQCKVTSPFLPGSNYLLFDDLSISGEAPEAATAPELTYLGGTGVQLRWLQEAGYRYEIRQSDTLGSWRTATGGAAAAASSTGFTGLLTDISATGVSRRYYQLIRTFP